MSSEEIRFRRIDRPSELSMSPSGILQRCLYQPSGFFFLPLVPAHRRSKKKMIAGMAVAGGEGGRSVRDER